MYLLFARTPLAVDEEGAGSVLRRSQLFAEITKKSTGLKAVFNQDIDDPYDADHPVTSGGALWLFAARKTDMVQMLEYVGDTLAVNVQAQTPLSIIYQDIGGGTEQKTGFFAKLKAKAKNENRDDRRLNELQMRGFFYVAITTKAAAKVMRGSGVIEITTQNKAYNITDLHQKTVLLNAIPKFFK